MATKQEIAAHAAAAEKELAEAKIGEAEQDKIAADKKAAEQAAKSPKIIELEAARKAAKLKAREFEPDSDEETAELDKAYKITLDIKAEIAKIANEKAEADLQLKRSERIALNDAQFVALFGNSEAFEVFKAALPVEQHDKFKAANEIVSNELLSKFAATAKTKAVGTSTNGKVSDSEKASMAEANYNSGMTDKANRGALIAAGIPKSSAWHAVNDYQLANKLPKRS